MHSYDRGYEVQSDLTCMDETRLNCYFRCLRKDSMYTCETKSQVNNYGFMCLLERCGINFTTHDLANENGLN